MFNVSLLHINHSEALESSSFRQVNNPSRFLPLYWKVVSSANNRTFSAGVAKGKSLISKRKRSGPSILSCGTPTSMDFGLESLPFIET